MGRSRAPEPPASELAETDLLMAGAAAAAGPAADPDRLEELIVELVTRASRLGEQVLDRPATLRLVELAVAAYEKGWQPKDLVHIARRESTARLGRLAAAVVAEQSRSSEAVGRLPATWTTQIDALIDQHEVGAGSDVGVGWTAGRWQREQGLNVWEGWHDLLGLMGYWSDLPAVTKLIPPPSAWTRTRSTVGPPIPGHPKMLGRIRGLLAKAEGTTFAHEADALTAKAQELMTRYSIDEAMTVTDSFDQSTESVRIHLDEPYASSKVQLLGAVCAANRCRAIWDDQHGFATVIGSSADLEWTELLFTSLLVQATRAMTATGSTTAGKRIAGADRSPSFRRAFLLAYAARIGERLTEAGRQAVAEVPGADVVLASASAAVDATYRRLFPGAEPMRTVQVNAAGWESGRAAASGAAIGGPPARRAVQG